MRDGRRVCVCVMGVRRVCVIGMSVRDGSGACLLGV